jgi:uncharacterized protein YndB with AHSA1/START domain
MTTTTTAQATQVFSIAIKAAPETIWEAITTPEFTQRYFHGARITVAPDHYHSLGPDGSIWGDADVLEFDPPRRLVHGWRSLYDAELAEEPPSRVMWDIEPQEGGYCLLTVTHDQLEESPKTAAHISGWTFIISSLKTLLETGAPLAA